MDKKLKVYLDKVIKLKNEIRKLEARKKNISDEIKKVYKNRDQALKKKNDYVDTKRKELSRDISDFKKKEKGFAKTRAIEKKAFIEMSEYLSDLKVTLSMKERNLSLREEDVIEKENKLIAKENDLKGRETYIHDESTRVIAEIRKLTQQKTSFDMFKLKVNEKAEKTDLLIKETEHEKSEAVMAKKKFIKQTAELKEEAGIINKKVQGVREETDRLNKEKDIMKKDKIRIGEKDIELQAKENELVIYERLINRKQGELTKRESRIKELERSKKK